MIEGLAIGVAFVGGMFGGRLVLRRVDHDLDVASPPRWFDAAMAVVYLVFAVALVLTA